MPPAWAAGVVGSTPAAVRRRIADAALTRFSLDHVVPRDLASAHAEGLLLLGELACPHEAAAAAVDLAGLPAGPGVAERVADARSRAGSFVVADGPDWADLDPAAFAREWRSALETHALDGVLNVNCGDPPPWSGAAAVGPLFGPAADAGERRRAAADALVSSGCRCLWHVAADDLANIERLRLVVMLALDGAPIEFAWDRPRRPVLLGPGLDRSSTAALATVGMNLAALSDLSAGADPEAFLLKVASLARFAKTWGHVRLDFLRKEGRPAVREGFLLERGRVVVVPHGLGDAALGAVGPASAADFAGGIVRFVRDALENDRPRRLPVAIDSDLAGTGVTLSDPAWTARQQVRHLSPLHAAAGGGCAVVAAADADEALDALAMLKMTDVARVHFVVRKSDDRTLASGVRLG